MRRVMMLVAMLGLVGTGVSVEPARADESGDYVVIVNAFNPFTTMTQEDLAKMFLKKRVTWMNEQEAFPVDQHEQSAVRRLFSARVLNKDIAAVKQYWQQQVFSGRAVPPPVLEGDEAVIEFVRSHPYGIGYVSRSATLGANVRTIAVTR
jgi:ABC-type phosphate transport system substrate-binding protein